MLANSQASICHSALNLKANVYEVCGLRSGTFSAVYIDNK